MATTPVRPPLSAGNNSAEPKEKGLAITPRMPIPFFVRELRKFIGAEVVVDFVLGTEVISIEGKLVAFQEQSLHCVVDCVGVCQVVRIPLRITRSRKS
jgi:hypothetical protein